MLYLVPTPEDGHDQAIPLAVTMTPLKAHAHRYVLGRYRRGEIAAPTRDAITYSLSTLCDSFGNRPPSSLGRKAVDRWLETLADRAPATRRNYLSRGRAFARYLMAEGIIARDPFAHVPAIREPRREPVTLTRTQVEQLHQALPDLRARLIVEMMDGLGARCCEMANLHVEDYDASKARVVLRGKAGHERLVTLPAATQAMLEQYLDSYGIGTGPLIRNRNDPAAGLKAATFSHYLRNWMWAAGVKRRALDGRSAHALRRTCGSELMEATGDVRVVQAVLGHARIETTARFYLRTVALTRMAEAMAARTTYLTDLAQAVDAELPETAAA